MWTPILNPFRIFSASLLVCLTPAFVGAESLVWPTPSTAFAEGLPYTEFVQATASGNPESALFGCVRNDGRRFHEGLDIRPILPRRRGEATDPIYAVADATVAYVNSVAGNSSYGRYIVLVHDQHEPAFYTLYAHLRSVDDSIEIGGRVEQGQVIGIMGRSAGGYTIPQSRAHLHFETGLRLSDSFQNWYDQQGFGSANHHGVYNGMNLVAWDPLDFYEWKRDFPGGTTQDYLDGLIVGAIIQVRSSRIPDFVQRYPALLTRAIPSEGVGGWQIEFSAWGLPIRWTPLTTNHSIAERNEGEVIVSGIHPSALQAYACRQLISMNGEQAGLGSGGERIIRLLFDFN